MVPARYVLLSSILLAVVAAPCAATANSDARFDGTFVQLTRANAEWTDSQWESLFAHLKTLSVTRVIIQWSLYDDLAFYSSPTVRSNGRSPIVTILRLADRSHMTVMLGLVEDSAYWSQIRRAPALVDVYLRRLRLRSEAVARELAGETRAHESFVGWYISQELDDVSWTSAGSWQILVDYVCRLSTALHTLSPGARVAVSGFSNGSMDPERLADRWGGLATKADVDLMFQDGVGADKLAIEDLEPYYAALHDALPRRSTFQIVVEVFAQTAGSGDSNAFAARPAPLERVLRQIEVASRYATGPLVVFSAPDYMTPEGGAEAGQLYEAYLSLQKRP